MVVCGDFYVELDARKSYQLQVLKNFYSASYSNGRERFRKSICVIGATFQRILGRRKVLLVVVNQIFLSGLHHKPSWGASDVTQTCNISWQG